VTEKKREGRPPLDPNDPSVTISFRLPGKEYDATLAHAKDARLDLGDYIRTALRRINARPPSA
jgi:hypothetical protein